jgi:CRP/FNR family transcriptional regulator
MLEQKNATVKEIIQQNFPVFSQDNLLEEMSKISRWFQHEKEEQMVQVGDFPKWIPLVIRGAIKVSRVDDDGSEIFLYYLYPGQTCAMTLNCCMVDKPSEVKAVAEAGTEYIGLPRQKIAEWMLAFDSWRSFTLESYNERYENLLATIDAIAFSRLDERLLQLLEDKSIATGGTLLDITHKKLAEELHSSREVISRLLKQLETKGKVKLSRNNVELL